jgi:exosortase
VASAGVPARIPTVIRVGAAIAAVAAGYHFSLAVLASDWRHDTPLAHLILVPPLAAVLLVGACRRHRHVASFGLSRLDLLVAAIFFLVPLVIVAVGPVLWSKYFWAMRLDLLTLPLFASATIALLFGSRALVPLAFPLAFLLLAWPLPYLAVLEHALGAFTRATTIAVATIADTIGIATPVPGSDQSRYLIAHEGAQTVVSVASACSGVNSLIGFLVVGVAALWLVRGRIGLRLAWLLTGAVLVLMLNVLRIVAVLVVARLFGERAAFELLHPVAGILVLNVGFLLLLQLLPLFGLHRRPFGDDESDVADSPLAASSPLEEQATPARLIPRLALLVAGTVVLALANGQLASSAIGFEATGRPAVGSFIEHPGIGDRWRVLQTERITWGTQYYGRDSSWVRYRLRPTNSAGGARPFTVWVDAVVSTDLGALNVHTLARCYDFHGYRVDTAKRVALGNGVIAQLFVYRTKRGVWHALAWQSPVLHQGSVRHERIVLLARTLARTGGSRSVESTSLTQRLLAVLNLRASDAEPNPGLTHGLERLATSIVAAQIAGGNHK